MQLQDHRIKQEESREGEEGPGGPQGAPHTRPRPAVEEEAPHQRTNFNESKTPHPLEANPRRRIHSSPWPSPTYRSLLCRRRRESEQEHPLSVPMPDLSKDSGNEHIGKATWHLNSSAQQSADQIHPQPQGAGQPTRRIENKKSEDEGYFLGAIPRPVKNRTSSNQEFVHKFNGSGGGGSGTQQ
ncbi:unnamed protein product [Arctogadus glacialis]